MYGGHVHDVVKRWRTKKIRAMLQQCQAMSSFTVVAMHYTGGRCGLSGDNPHELPFYRSQQLDEPDSYLIPPTWIVYLNVDGAGA